MKSFLLIAGVALTAAFAASAFAAGAGPQGAKSRQADKGRAVYEAKCTRCHGADGRGKTRMGEISEAPDLTDPAYISDRSNARLIASVTNGSGQMPAFKKKLSRRDIAAAVAYVRTLKR